MCFESASFLGYFEYNISEHIVFVWHHPLWWCVTAGWLIVVVVVMTTVFMWHRYEMLDPDSCIDDNEEDLDMGHLLSKMTAPNTSIGFSDVIDHIISIFNGGNQQTSYSDVSGKIFCSSAYLIQYFPIIFSCVYVIMNKSYFAIDNLVTVNN